MKTKPLSTDGQIAREVERERRERSMRDEERAGLVLSDDLRTKDAREHFGAVNLKRPAER